MSIGKNFITSGVFRFPEVMIKRLDLAMWFIFFVNRVF